MQLPPPPHQERRRLAGLDIVRAFAAFAVVAGHFFINTPMQTALFEGPSMFIQGMGRQLFQVNVPLFLILTGYLNLNKQVSRSYYRTMVSVVVSYLFISLVTAVVLQSTGHVVRTPLQWILATTNFSAIAYAWYIEMWIGLFLLTPFLNILWHNIATQRHKLLLIATFYLLCAVPDFTNRYGVHLMPGYWIMVYPLAFYFIGAYIKEFSPQFGRWRLVAFVLACCLINPVFNLLIVKGHSMIQIAGGGHGLIGMPLAAAVFLLLYKVDINGWIRKVVESFSRHSLDIYLASYMFDVLVYSWLKPRYYIDQGQFGIWFFVVVPVVFLSAYFFAVVKSYLFRLLHLPTR